MLDEEVFYNRMGCPACGEDMKLYLDEEIYRCGVRSCRKARSFRWGTFLSESRLSSAKMLYFAYLWILKTSSDSVMTQLGMLCKTVGAMRRCFSEVVSDSLDFVDFKIEREGIVVEVDETKLGKRKFHRGHKVEGVWVLGGVEHTPERKIFLVPVPSRDRPTLLGILSEHVLPGSIIRTDLWRGYMRVDRELDLRHETVNHTLYFRDPQTSVHTNTIEGTWNELKLTISTRNRVRDFMEERLFEFISRRKNAIDLWTALIKAMRDVHYESD